MLGFHIIAKSQVLIFHLLQEILAIDMLTNQLNPVLQVILAGTLTGVQGHIRCKVLAALSTVK